MPKPHFLSELVSQLSNALPSQTAALKKDFEANCQRILSTTFSKLNLVTREEFDTQTKVLLRTRKKLEELEKLLKKMESGLKKKERN